jgi:hypothetical protein
MEKVKVKVTGLNLSRSYKISNDLSAAFMGFHQRFPNFTLPFGFFILPVCHFAFVPPHR